MSWIEKISCPVVCVTDDLETEYENGTEIRIDDFSVVSITAKDNKIVLTLEKAEKSHPPMNWVGEMPVAEGEWTEVHKKQIGTEPSFF